MSSRVLVVYHTVEGQTARIARRIADRLEDAGDDAVVACVSAAPSPAPFDAVVVGGSIHAVHHSRQLRRYLRENARALAAKPCAVFQVSLTSANPDEAHTETANAMVRELLDETDFSPELVGTFAGAPILYSRYGWLKRRIMRSIVRREGGDTDVTRDYEYTNWEAIDRFADDVHVLAAADARVELGEPGAMSTMGATTAADGAEVQTAPSRLIVPLSGSYHGMRALPHATDLARRLDAGLTLVTVPNDLDYDRVTEVPAWLQVLRDRVDLERVDLLVTDPGDPPRTILEVLDGTDGAALCIATHARSGASELVHHHVARSVLRRSNEPAWIVGRDCSRHPRTGPIIVCHDGTNRSDAIVAIAGRWGLGLGVGFRLVHMVEALDSDSAPTPAVSRATALLGRKTEVVAMHSAFPVWALVQFACNAGASAIAVALPPGTDHGLGHLASNLIRESTCPVLTARASS